jgi:predicted Zn-dependent protease
MRYRKHVVAGCAVALLAVGVYWFLRGPSPSAEQREAFELAERHKYREAIPKLKKVLEREPDNVEALVKLIDCLMKSGALMVDVLPYLSRLCELRPDDSSPFRLRMDTLVALGRSKEALADAQRVLELRPEEHAARLVAARLLLDAGRHDEAESECRTLLESKGPPRYDVLTLLAQAQMGRGDLPAAAETLGTVLREQPGRETATLYLGIVRFKQDKHADAIGLLKGLTASSDPGVRQAALYHFAMALNAAGRGSEAQGAFERLAVDQKAQRYKMDAGQLPGDRDLQVRAARALRAADYVEEAVQLLEDAAARLGDWPDALKLLADCLDQQGRKDRAEEVRRRLTGL